MLGLGLAFLGGFVVGAVAMAFYAAWEIAG